MVATAVLLLDHVPPVTELVSDVVELTHTVPEPDIAAGMGFTVTLVVVKQPAGNVYVIVAMPAALPVTTGPDTEAMPGLLEDQLPPLIELASVVEAPTHTVAVPVMAPGTGFTVKPVVVLQPAGNV
jgi:hypothetical protein